MPAVILDFAKAQFERDRKRALYKMAADMFRNNADKIAWHEQAALNRIIAELEHHARVTLH